MATKNALLIATSAYDDRTLASLTAPVADVDALGRLLSHERVGAFDDVKSLVNRPEAEIRREIGRFFLKRDRDDVLVLYFSGHGILDRDGHLHLAAKDTQRELMSATAIPASFVRAEMDACRSTRQVLILDCCHSGAFGRGAKGVGANVRETFQGDGSARVIMTATDAIQFAWEADRIIGGAVASLFTHFLIEGMNTGAADEDGDGEISADELFHYASRRVREQAPGQTPQMWTFAETGRMVLAKNRSPRATPALIEQVVVERARSLFSEDRITAVRILAETLASAHRGRALAAKDLLIGLSKDDSRKVSEAAAAALGRPPAPPVAARPPPPPAPSPARSVTRPKPVAPALAPETGAPAAANNGGGVSPGRAIANIESIDERRIKDDSRKVSEAAAAALGRPPAPPVAARPPPPPAPSPARSVTQPKPVAPNAPEAAALAAAKNGEGVSPGRATTNAESFDARQINAKPVRSPRGKLARAVAALALITTVAIYGIASTERNGTLTITTTPPDAWVEVDGVMVSRRSPASIEIPPGRHWLMTHGFGYVTLSQPVELVAGQELKLAVALEPAPDTGFELTSAPPGGLIWMDGAPVAGTDGQQARTDFRAARIPTGPHRLKVDGAPGYEPWEQDVTIEPGQTTKVRATLVAMAKPKEPEPEPEPEPKPVSRRVKKAATLPPPPADITRVINNNRGGIKVCYRRALERDTSLTKGKVDIRLLVGLSGRVKQVGVDGPRPFLQLKPCIQDVISRWVFPASPEEFRTEFSYVFQGNE